MDKLKVFLSSKMDDKNIDGVNITYRQLREKVSQFMSSLLHVEIKKFELLTPSPQTPKIVYLNKLPESDIYLGFFGPEYSHGTIEEFLNDACYNPYVFLLCTRKNNVFKKGSRKNNNKLKEVKSKLEEITHENLDCGEIKSFLKDPHNSKLGKKLKNIISEEIAIKELFNLFPEDAIEGGELKVLYHPKVFINKQNMVNRCLNCKISLIKGPSGSGKTALLRQCIYKYIREHNSNKYIYLKNITDIDIKEVGNIPQEVKDPLFFFDNIQEINMNSLEIRMKLIKSIIKKFPESKIIFTIRTDQKKVRINKIVGYIEKEFEQICIHDITPSFNQSDIELLNENFRFLRKQWGTIPLTPRGLENIQNLSGGLIGDIVEILNHLYSEWNRNKNVDINSLVKTVSGNLNTFRWKRIADKEKDFLKHLSLFKGWVGIEVAKRIYNKNFPISHYIINDGIKIKIFPDRFRDYIYNKKVNKKFKVTNHEKVLNVLKDLLNQQTSGKDNFAQDLKLFDMYNYNELKKIAPHKAQAFCNFLKDIGIWLENVSPFTAIEVLREYYTTIISQNMAGIDFKAIYKLIELNRMYGDIDKAINISNKVLPLALSTPHKCDFLGNHIRLLQRKSLEKAVEYIKSHGDILSECYDDPIFSNLIARLYRDLGDFKEAEEFAYKALDMIESYNWKYENEKIKRKAEIHYTLGSILVYNGEYNVARNYLKSSIELRQRVNDHQGVPYCYYTISLSFLAENKFSEATNNLKKAREYMIKHKIQDARMEFKLKILDLWIEFKKNFRTLKINKVKNLLNKTNNLEKQYLKYYEGKDGDELRLLKAFLLVIKGSSKKDVFRLSEFRKIKSCFLRKEYATFISLWNGYYKKGESQLFSNLL